MTPLSLIVQAVTMVQVAHLNSIEIFTENKYQLECKVVKIKIRMI